MSNVHRTGTPGHGDYRLELYPHRGRIAVLAAGATLFAFGCAFLVVSAVTGAESSPVAGVIGVVGTAFFGLGTFYALARLIQRTPVLIVDAIGIHDHASMAAAGTIPWENIAAVHVDSFGMQRMLMVAACDTQEVVDRASGLRRALLATNARMMATPVNIPAMMLPMRAREVESEITAHLTARWEEQIRRQDDRNGA